MEATLGQEGRKGTGWSIALGAFIVIAGIAAIALPALAAVATNYTLAWLVLFSGVLELVHAVQTRHDYGFGLKLTTSVLSIALGVLLMIFPVEGIAAIALLLAALIFGIGIVEISLALKLRPRRRWGWVLATGMLSAVAGILIAVGWPADSFYVIGVYVGISMIASGLWRIILTGKVRELGKMTP